MATINKLTAKQITNLPEGLHSDGGNLYLSVRTGGSRQWIVRYRFGGKQRDLGLGGAGPGGMTLAEARGKAEKIRGQLRDGIDPLAKKAEVAKTKAVPTFRAEMNEYITRAEPSWKNPKSAHQWRASLETHARAIIDLPVDQIDVNHLIKVFEPIWYTLPETARRVRGRIEAILSLSKTKGNRTGENPAAWRDNLKNIFKSTPTLVHGHFASMYYQEVPNFLRDLRLRDSMSAVALEWIILTVSRAQVAVSATWSEINIERRLWRIKSARMKGDKEAAITGEDHVVPLTARAIAILEVMSKLRLTNRGDELIFPSTYGKPLSLTALDHCRERMNVFTTTHGFRSTFRTWVGEQTFHEEALAEKALAHVIGDEVKRAYNRGELLEKRRVLMNDWSDYLDGIITQEKNPFVRQGGVLPTIVMDALKTRRS